MNGWVDPNFWSGKEVLITGHSGFKGAWLSHWLLSMKAKVTGVSLPPETQPNLFDLTGIANRIAKNHFTNINDLDAIRRVVHDAQPEIVIHLAAQPLVRKSYQLPVETFSTNLMGTVHLLESLRPVSPAVVLVVTTDKVYRGQEHGIPHRESDPLGGHDPYSASKAATEMAVESYRLSYLREIGTKVASARAGNVIGGGDWSSDRLIPDAVRAWQHQLPLEIRHPNSVRPWQHVLDCLAGYLVLVQSIHRGQAESDSYNFGPNASRVVSVRDVIEKARNHWGNDAQVTFRESDSHVVESSYLMLDSTKTQTQLGFRPAWGFEESVGRTIRWYRRYLEGYDPRILCDEDLAEHEARR